MSVFCRHSDIVSIDEKDIVALKSAAFEAPLKRARYCLHRDSDAPVQEMVIAVHRESRIPVHRHMGKCESVHMIEGEMEILVYNEKKELDTTIGLGPLGSGRSIFCRISSEIWHSVKPLSEFVVFHETTRGPFLKEETQVFDDKID